MHPLNSLLARVGLSVKKTSSGFFDFDSLVLAMTRRLDEFSFVQIGANDGVTSDPLARLLPLIKGRIIGTVVEPVSEYFAELVSNYQQYPAVKPLQFAIHPRADHLTIFYPSKASRKKSGPLAKGIASADPDHWRKSNFVSDSSEIESEKVECISVNSLMDMHGLNIDLLIVDTEGMDFEILMDLDLARFQISVIRFEHGLRDSIMSMEQLNQLIDKLNSHGFQVFLESYDGVAIHLNVLHQVA